jgi:hypothetical protein
VPDNKEELKKKTQIAIEKTVVVMGGAKSSEWPAILEKLVSYTRRLAVCVDCGERLDPALRDRCPFHATVQAGKTFAADKFKEHAPKIFMNVYSKGAEALEKFLGDPNAPAPEEEQP